MGTVYRAADDAGHVAAVKVLSPELTNDELFRGRFAREAEALAQLDHPHIVCSFGSGMDDGTVFLAMEFVDGQNYERRLGERGRLPWSEVLAVGRQVAEALKHAHDRGVIHRDLKPANILLVGDPDGPGGVNVKLTDFGVAKIFASAPLTAAGSFVGTAAYLAPEQAAGKPPAKRGDFYSLGCVLYALLVGRPPFAGDSVTELIHQHRFAQPEQPVRFVPDLPHDLNALVMNLLEKDPGKRPADASVLIRQIERLAGKLERQGRTPHETLLDPETDPTVSHDLGGSPGPGPATIAAEFVRSELERQNRGGPVARFLNHPAVLVSLLLLCLAGIAWGLLRPQPPAPPAADRNAEDVAEQRSALLPLKRSRSAAEMGYRAGLWQLQDGNWSEARRTWTNVVQAFDGVAAEDRWVTLAKAGLAELNAAPRPDLSAALDRARSLRDVGKSAEADAVLAALEALFGGDPQALDLIRRAKKPG